MKQNMQESAYYKPGGELVCPDPSSGGLFGTPSLTGFEESAGIFGGADWTGAGMGPSANGHDLQQDAADNTAVGRICIPA